MIDLRHIPAAKEDLDSYEVNNIFHSWSFQPPASPPQGGFGQGGSFHDRGRPGAVGLQLLFRQP